MKLLLLWFVLICAEGVRAATVLNHQKLSASPACVTTNLTNICIDRATGDLVQLNGHVMLPGSGTVLQDCVFDNNSKVPLQLERLADGGLCLTRALMCAPNIYHDVPTIARTAVVDTFTPSSDGTVTWTVSVSGEVDAPSPWSTEIQTALGYRDWAKQGAMAWVGGPHVAELPSATFDPLAPFTVDQPAESYGDFIYGSSYSSILNRGRPSYSDNGRATHLPVLARIDDTNSTAVIQSLEYVPIVSSTNVGVESSLPGSVWLNYTRRYERLGGATPGLNFTQHVLAIPTNDWRPAVAWLNAEYPEWFEPNPKANALDWEGPASYADVRGPSDFPAEDAPHYAAMGYKLNWDSTARFPWHGEFVPTDADGVNGENWTTCFAHDAPDAHVNEPCETVSYADLSGWYAHQRSLGFRTCNYANLFQFGWYTNKAWITDKAGGGAPDPTVNCSAAATGGTSQDHQEQALLCHTQKLLAPGAPGGYGTALIVQGYAPGDAPAGYPGPPLQCMGLDGSCGMDPHPDLPYLAHVLDMVRTGIERTNSSGICIDRQDWLGFVNPRADDGRTWFPYFSSGSNDTNLPKFGPVRALIFSWNSAMTELAKLMRSNGKAIIINDHVNRIGMMQHVDGIYDEMGDIGEKPFGHVFGSALIAMHKPVISWIHDGSRWGNLDNLEQALQGFLYLGVYPTVPVKNNDHAIGGDCAPNCSYDALFTDYGPLFMALRGKRWVLEPHAAEMLGGNGLVNLFETRQNGGFVAVLAQVPASNSKISLALPGCAVPTGTALQPGGGRVAVNLESTIEPGRFQTVVPIVRNCTVVVITCGDQTAEVMTSY